MKNCKLLIFFCLLTITVNSQPPNGGGSPCPPFSPCWCLQHPNHPACRQLPPAVPISDYWYLLVGGGLLIGAYTLKTRL